MKNTTGAQGRVAIGVLALAACALSGCRTPLDLSGLTRSDDAERLASTADVTGPLERLLSRKRGEKESNSLAQAEGLQDYRKAEKLYDAGQHKDAEKAFKKIAKKYKDSPVAEDALFMRAESQFALKRYSWAQDGYDELIKEFPTTRHMDRVTNRLFTIGRSWLDFPEIATSSEIQQVDFENLGSTPPPEPTKETSFDPTKSIPVLPNFHNRSRPVFDTKGRALQALKSIWMNDPTGPLADDALMLTASHYLRSGNNVEADRYYTMVREEYPKSPHFENAYKLGAHVKLMSYQGASYDGKSLEDAKSLKATSLRMFGNMDDRQRLETEIAKIGVAEADRDWKMVEYWQGKNKPKAAAVYCREIIRQFPRTPHATRARKLLAEIEPGNVAMSARRPSPSSATERRRIPRELIEDSAKPSPAKRLKDWMPNLRPTPKREDEPSTLDPIPQPNNLQQASTPRSSRPSRFSVGSPLKAIKGWWPKLKPVPNSDAKSQPAKPATTLDVTGRVKL
jgi:outer membrane protein assembly factor BamD (BamD/ComL family)